MNSKELHNLQEAYMEVVENQQLDEGKSSRPRYASRGVLDQETRDEKREASAENMRGHTGGPGTVTKNPKKLRKQRALGELGEQVDLYDIILSHLLDEGYVETPEAAEAIMVNMSEEWRDSILEAYVPWDFGPKQTAKKRYDELVDRKKSGGSKPGTATRANKIAKVAREMRKTLDDDSRETGTDPKKQGLQPSTPRHTAAARRRADAGLPSSSTAKKVYG